MKINFWFGVARNGSFWICMGYFLCKYLCFCFVRQFLDLLILGDNVIHQNYLSYEYQHIACRINAYVHTVTRCRYVCVVCVSSQKWLAWTEKLSSLIWSAFVNPVRSIPSSMCVFYQLPYLALISSAALPMRTDNNHNCGNPLMLKFKLFAQSRYCCWLWSMQTTRIDRCLLEWGMLVRR